MTVGERGRIRFVIAMRTSSFRSSDKTKLIDTGRRLTRMCCGINLLHARERQLPLMVRHLVHDASAFRSVHVKVQSVCRIFDGAGYRRDNYRFMKDWAIALVATVNPNVKYVTISRRTIDIFVFSSPQKHAVSL